MSTDSITTWLPTGALLEGRWQIHGKLGRGGFATVYHGQHIKLERDAAIKVLDIQATPEEMRVFEERFLREAKLAAKLDHPNIVQILDYGMTRRDGITKPFLVMERLSGHDLEHELISRGPLSRERARALFLPALDALAVCHQQGVVHRDLKPSNLFIVHPNTSRERLVVLDFGIARAFEDPNSRLTATSHFTGTPAYLAPEYISDQHVSPALDVYQMGLILSESITGTPVVQASAPLGYLMAHCNGKQHIPDVLLNTPVGEILERAVRVNPEERPAHAGILRAELARAEWSHLPERWDTMQKSSVVSTLPDAPIITQEGVNPWGETVAPTHTPEQVMTRPDLKDVPTDPVTFDASATHPDMNAPATAPSDGGHGGLKIAIAAIFALGVLLGGGALMLIALRGDTTVPLDLMEEPLSEPVAMTTTEPQPTSEAPTIGPPSVPPTEPIVDEPIKPATAIVQALPPTTPKSAEPAKKPAHHEPFDLLEPTDVDAKLMHGHVAIEAMTLSVERSHIALLKRMEDLDDEREHEAASYFSDISDEYTRAAKSLESLARHAPSSGTDLDTHARSLALIMHDVAQLASTSYDYRMNTSTPHTKEEVHELVAKWTTLIDRWRPVHDTFLLAFLSFERDVLKARYDNTASKTGPLMHHYHGVMLSLVRAMESTQRYQNAVKTKPHVRSLNLHSKALDSIDLFAFKEQLDSRPRNSIQECALAALRASTAFAGYHKVRKKYATSKKLSHQHKLASARLDMYRRYNFAMKKYTRRPEL